MSGASKLRRYACFDGVRGLAATVVIFSHLPLILNGGFYNTLWGAEHAIRFGYIMLDQFFFISGFFITRILLNERARTGRISLTAFYARRSLRIFPIYYLAIAVTYFVFHYNLSELLSALTYTFNYYHPIYPTPHPLEHTWSLSVEEQFYLFWPLLIGSIPLSMMAVVTGRIVPAIAIASGLGIAAWFGKHDQLLSGNLVYMSLCTRMLSLSLGGWLAFREFEDKPVTQRTCIALLASGIVVLAIDLSARSLGLIGSQALYWTIALTSYAMISVAIASTLVFDGGRIASVLRGILSVKPLRGVGQISYALYLFHLPILYYFGLNEAALGGGSASALVVIKAVAITFILAVLSQFLIERPCMSLRRFFDPAARKGAPRSAAPQDGALGEIMGRANG